MNNQEESKDNSQEAQFETEITALSNLLKDQVAVINKELPFEYRGVVTWDKLLMIYSAVSFGDGTGIQLKSSYYKLIPLTQEEIDERDAKFNEAKASKESAS